MKALTICQPFAHLIVRGEMRVENRGSHTYYRGPLAIHAGKSRAWLCENDEPLFAALGDPIVYGAVVGIATLVDALYIDRILSGEYDQRHPWLRDHAYTSGGWCWVLQDVKRITPIPWSGSLRLWDFPDSALEEGSRCPPPPLTGEGTDLV